MSKKKSKQGASRARNILAVYASETNVKVKTEGVETVATDLLADVMHLCAASGADFNRVLRCAVQHFAAESNSPQVATIEGALPANSIGRFKLLHDRNNPQGFEVAAERSGDTGIYEEARFSAFVEGSNDCVADVLIGLSAAGELRVLVTTGGNGDGDHALSIFPMRDLDDAVVKGTV